MADLGFLQGGGANSPGGASTYDFAKLSPKLHEIERIWTPGGDARQKFYYVDPPLAIPLEFTCNCGERLRFNTSNGHSFPF